MSWYRTGTVSVTNGSKTVTGVGTLWTTAVNAGDAFALVDANLNPTGAWYEVESVTNNTTLVLKQSYAGTTGSNKQYCVFNLVGNMTTPSFAQRLATFFASFQSLIDKPTTTPTASSIPIADSGGKIADGWIPATVARLASPMLTGTPAAPTAPKATNTTQLATTAHVKSVVADYAPLASPALTGTPTAPTQTAGDDSTKIATTAYVKDQVASDTVAGMVELATPAEVLAGVDDERAVTPAGFLSGFRGNILGTVSQSGGVPTGAVIERGSNANGEYVKFADGTMICSGRRSVGVSNTAYASVQVTLPATYNATTSMYFFAAIGSYVDGAVYVHGRSENLSTSAVHVVAFALDSYVHTGTLYFSFTCVGRWF